MTAFHVSHRTARSLRALTFGPAILLPLQGWSQHLPVGDFLTPHEMSAVERQIEHTRDEDGNRLRGWIPQTPGGERSKDSFLDRMDQMNRRLDTIRVPKMHFENAPAPEVLDWLKSVLESAAGEDPKRKLEVIVTLPEKELEPRKLTLELDDATAREALERFAGAIGGKLMVAPFNVSIDRK